MTKEQIKKYEQLKQYLNELKNFRSDWHELHMTLHNGGRHYISLSIKQAQKIQELVAEEIYEIEEEIKKI